MQNTKNASEIALLPKVISLLKEWNKLIEKVNINMSSQEEQFVTQFLTTRVIPSPKLLIKYHNAIDKKGETYNQISYPCKQLYHNGFQSWITWDTSMLEKVKVNYSRFTIVQESELKD